MTSAAGFGQVDHYHTLLPLLVFLPLIGYYLVALGIFGVRRIRGERMFWDAEAEARGQSILLPQTLRQAASFAAAPLVRLLQRSGVHPLTLTLLGAASALCAGGLLANGWVAWGGVVGFLGASLDYFDGRIARATGRASPLGNFLDSTLDRYGEAAFFGGAAYLFAGSRWALTACVVALSASQIVSYTRAKAESLGVPLAGGLMQRPERVVIFCLGASFGPAFDGVLPAQLQGQHFIFAASVGLIACLTSATAVSRTIQGALALWARDPSNLAARERHVTRRSLRPAKPLAPGAPPIRPH